MKDNKQILKDLFLESFDHLLTKKKVVNICKMIDEVDHEAWKKGFQSGSDIWKKALENMGKKEV